MSVSRRCVWKCIEVGDRNVYMNMHAVSSHGPLDLSHRHPGRLVQFGLAVTAAAATVAWLLSAVARLSEPATVLTVMTLAFVTSWVITNHRRPSSHRVTVVHVRARAH